MSRHTAAPYGRRDESARRTPGGACAAIFARQNAKPRGKAFVPFGSPPRIASVEIALGRQVPNGAFGVVDPGGDRFFDAEIRLAGAKRG